MAEVDNKKRKVSFLRDPDEAGEEEEGMEEHKEPSYELFQPPPEEEACYGTIVRDTYGLIKIPKESPAGEERRKSQDRTEVDPEGVGEEEEMRIGEGGESESEMGREGLPISQKRDFHLETKDAMTDALVVHRYTLWNPKGTQVQVITYGATITSIKMPDNKNRMADIILGFDSLEDYMDVDKNKHAFGAILGRFSSTISEPIIKINRREHILSTNVGGLHHEAGGFKGFDKGVFDSSVAGDKVIMTLVSPDGEEGYPGLLMTQISFQLTLESELVVQTRAVSSKPTIIGLAHNIYFNLGGHETGKEGVKYHSIVLNADRFIKIDDTTKFPDGSLERVTSTYFDLRIPRPICKAMRKLPGGGYCHTFCLTKTPGRSLAYAGRLLHVGSGRYLEIMTDKPGLFLDTGTKFPDPEQLPPLEPTGKDRKDDLFPPFCRDQNKMEAYTKELQEQTSARQSWSRQETATNDPEMDAALDKPRRGSQQKEKGGGDEDETDQEGEESKAELNLLKDPAESEEEVKKPVWEPPKPISGKKGAQYQIYGAICLRPQEYPDCMKFPHFPKPVIDAGEVHKSTTIYKFGIIPSRKNADNPLCM